MLTPSPDRIPVDCAVAGPCGGCSLRHLDYAAELRAKQENVCLLYTSPLLVGKMEQVCDGIVGAHHEVEACLYHIEQQHGHKGERK